jgi:hypothetical protein
LIQAEWRKPLFAQGLSAKMNDNRTAVKKRAVIANFLCLVSGAKKVLKIFVWVVSSLIA